MGHKPICSPSHSSVPGFRAHQQFPWSSSWGPPRSILGVLNTHTGLSPGPPLRTLLSRSKTKATAALSPLHWLCLWNSCAEPPFCTCTADVGAPKGLDLDLLFSLLQVPPRCFMEFCGFLYRLAETLSTLRIKSQIFPSGRFIRTNAYIMPICVYKRNVELTMFKLEVLFLSLRPKCLFLVPCAAEKHINRPQINFFLMSYFFFS